MRFFRNFLEFRNFPDLRGHSPGYPRSDLIFRGGGGCPLNCDCGMVYFLHSLKLVNLPHQQFAIRVCIMLI